MEPLNDEASASSEPKAASVLANPAYARLWLAQTLSTLGDRVHTIALTWWTISTTGSLAITGAMLAAAALPPVLLGPVAGTLADRWPRRRLMVACDGLRGVLVLGVAYAAASGGLTPPLMLVATALISTVSTFFLPAAASAIPLIVSESEILGATSWMEGTQQAMGLLGPAIGGLIVAWLGAGGAFAADGASYLVSAALLARLAIPRPAQDEAPEPFGRAMAAGFRLLRKDLTVGGALLGFGALNWFTMPTILFIPYFANQVFHSGARGMGALEASLGGGMMLAALYWARVGEVKRRAPVVVGGIAGVGVAIGTMGLWPSQAGHMAALALAGLAMGSVNVVMTAFFMARVPQAELGRFFGLLTSVTMGLMPLSFACYGLLASTVSPAQLLVINSCAIFAVAAGFLAIPGFKET